MLVLLAYGFFRGLPPGAAEAPKAPPNFILISMDTFRADRVGAYGNSRGLTPNLDRLAAESVVFRNAYSQSTVTGPSHTSLFTSRYPSELGDAANSEAGTDGHYTLAEVLDTYGYQTAARVAGGDLNPAVGPKRGFGSYESSVDFGSFWHTAPMAMKWLAGRDPERPFFLFVHGYDTHPTYLKPTPYGLLYSGLSVLTPPQQALLNATERVLDGKLHKNVIALEAVSRHSLRPRSPEGKAKLAELSAGGTLQEVPASDQQLIRDVYDGAVSYADVQVGLLMAALHADEKILENTIIVVFGDHGEALGEDGLFHRCCSLDDGLTHVPLLVRLPGGGTVPGGTVPGGAARVVDGMVELVDVFPTVLALAGAEAPAGIRGHSLVPALYGEPFEGRRAAVSEGGFGTRMVSARSLHGRATYTGIALSSPFLDDVLSAARAPGPSFAAAEGADEAEVAALRDVLVGWAEGLDLPEQKLVTAVPPALEAEMKARGYWEAK